MADKEPEFNPEDQESLIKQVLEKLKHNAELIDEKNELLTEVQNILLDLRELALKAAKPQTSPQERGKLQKEANHLLRELEEVTFTYCCENLGDMYFSDGNIFHQSEKDS